MATEAVWQIAQAVLVSVGGGGLIVLGLSHWLGKLWAERLMANEKQTHARELEALRDQLRLTTDTKLEELRNQLRHKTDAELERVRRVLDIGMQTHLREVSEKVVIYREAVDLVVDLIADFHVALNIGAQTGTTGERFDAFNRQRMKVYGRMAMLAPQPVVDAYTALTDRLTAVTFGKALYNWDEITALARTVLNEVRKDVGLNKTPIHSGPTATAGPAVGVNPDPSVEVTPTGGGDG